MSNSKYLSEECKLQDFRSKMAIAERILTLCQQEQGDEKPPITDIDKAVFHYTNRYIEKDVKTIPFERPFQQWLLEQNEDCPRYDEVRKLIVDFYITKRKIPTKILLNENSKFSPSTLQRDIECSGFIWVPLPNTQKSIIVENPQLAFKRHRYLQQILKYRDCGRNIVYIEDVDVTLTHNLKNIQHMFIAASGKEIINLLPTVQTSIEQYIQVIIAPVIPRDSIIVMVEKKNEKKISEVPKETSLNRDMTKWLTANNISNDETQHRSELFSLIQKCKRKCERDTYILDAILKRYGHVVLRRPRGTTSSLQFFTKFINELKLLKKPQEGMSRETYLKDVLSLYNTSDWAICEDQLIAQEKKMYDEDMKMEVIIDQLLTMAKYGSITIADLADLDNVISEDHLLSDVFAM